MRRHLVRLVNRLKLLIARDRQVLRLSGRLGLSTRILTVGVSLFFAEVFATIVPSHSDLCNTIRGTVGHLGAVLAAINHCVRVNVQS